jgi:hypothetical protein
MRAKRTRHLLTVAGLVCSCAAMALVPSPSAARRMMRLRKARRCSPFAARTFFSSALLSCAARRIAVEV